MNLAEKAPMTPRQQQPNEVLKHLTALDGVRGLAILLVLLYHLLWSNNTTGDGRTDLLVKLRASGWVGVDLFFVLSGFLITGILFDSLHDRHFFKNFYARRILRIFPLYYGVLFLLILFLHRSFLTAPVPFVVLAAYLQNTFLWFHRPHTLELQNLVGHFWSLAVEEQFYLVWPFILFAIRDRRRLILVCVFGSAVALLSRILLLHQGAPFQETYQLTFCRADSLLSGAWLALSVRGPARSKILRLAPIAFVSACALCLIVALQNRSFDWLEVKAVNQYGFTLVAVAATAFLAMALTPTSLTARAMQSPALRFLGRYSYGIYIYHQLVGAVTSAAILPHLKQHLQSKVLLHLASLTVSTGATIALAWLSFRFFEQPFLRLKRHFNYAAPPRPPIATDSIP